MNKMHSYLSSFFTPKQATSSSVSPLLHDLFHPPTSPTFPTDDHYPLQLVTPIKEAEKFPTS
jgi:hypothetical protein